MALQGAVTKTEAGVGWRTPLVILICGSLIGAIGFGPRASLGLFLTPMSHGYGWGRDVFGLALAIQVLVWGTVTPFAGAIADRFGSLACLPRARCSYCARSDLDGLFDDARRARHVGRRADAGSASARPRSR